jgi:hypothetical protein
MVLPGLGGLDVFSIEINRQLVLPWDRTFTSLLLMIFYDSQN